ncbi:hypothetical protein ACFC18_31445 [Streptomyces sp. NPDC056121]|uniref:hypothetical protein n=1 Tax=unclassified Streptomyces TaxID=2593676 RepID=UPI0035E28E72
MGGWGPPPPKKVGAGKTNTIVAGCIVGAAILLGGIRAVQGGRATTPDPSAQRYRLPLPETIDSGALRLGQGVSGRYENSANGGDAYAQSLQAKTGVYGADSGPGQLFYTGSFSEQQNPLYPKLGLLDGMGKNDSTTVAISRRDMTDQSSYGDNMACKVLTKAQGDQELTMAVCSWSDRYTQGTVIDDSPDSFGAAPE